MFQHRLDAMVDQPTRYGVGKIVGAAQVRIESDGKWKSTFCGVTGSISSTNQISAIGCK